MTKEAASGLFSLVLAFACGWFARAVDWSQIDLPIPIHVVVSEKPPVPGDGNHILIIRETDPAAQLPDGQREITKSVTFRELCTSKGISLRIEDPDTKLLNSEEWFVAAMGLQRDSLPWVVVSNGKTGYSGPLPASMEDMQAMVGRYFQ